MIDIREPKLPVQIILGREGQLWINVDGECQLRIHKAIIEIEDERNDPTRKEIENVR